MKFFKHFTDAHEGKSMMALMAKFGVEGYGAFFILTEMCAKKLEKSAGDEYSEEHLKFTINERLVREKLRMRSTKVELFLHSCATLDLLQYTKDQDEFHFYFPKLLECMDRDAKRARTERAVAAPKKKKKNKNKDKEEEIYIKAAPLFESAWDLFSKLPGVTKGSKAMARFTEQIRSDEDCENLMSAIANYRDFLAHPSNAWRKPKTTFETFLGTKSSGYFWRDYTKAVTFETVDDVPLNPDYFDPEVSA